MVHWNPNFYKMFSKGDIFAAAQRSVLANFAFLRLQIEKPGCGFSGKQNSYISSQFYHFFKLIN